MVATALHAPADGVVLYRRGWNRFQLLQIECRRTTSAAACNLHSTFSLAQMRGLKFACSVRYNKPRA